jgi:hypothetical protein
MVPPAKIAKSVAGCGSLFPTTSIAVNILAIIPLPDPFFAICCYFDADYYLGIDAAYACKRGKNSENQVNANGKLAL